MDTPRTAPALTDSMISVIAFVGVVGAVVPLVCAASCQFRSSGRLCGCVRQPTPRVPICFEVGAKVTLLSAVA
jgi:hypothetical protein